MPHKIFMQSFDTFLFSCYYMPSRGDTKVNQTKGPRGTCTLCTCALEITLQDRWQLRGQKMIFQAEERTTQAEVRDGSTRPERNVRWLGGARARSGTPTSSDLIPEMIGRRFCQRLLNQISNFRWKNYNNETKGLRGKIRRVSNRSIPA